MLHYIEICMSLFILYPTREFEGVWSALFTWSHLEFIRIPLCAVTVYGKLAWNLTCCPSPYHSTWLEAHHPLPDCLTLTTRLFIGYWFNFCRPTLNLHLIGRALPSRRQKSRSHWSDITSSSQSRAVIGANCHHGDIVGSTNGKR